MSKMQLFHEVKDRIDAAELLDSVTTIDEFCYRIEKLAKAQPTEDDQNCHKGELFELFVE